MKSANGFYWYRGPWFRNGKKSGITSGWTVVLACDGAVSGIGSASEHCGPDAVLMEQHGEFVRIEPPPKDVRTWFRHLCAWFDERDAQRDA